MKEFKKYGFRFGLLLAIALPLLYFTQGENAVKIIAYKTAMVSIGLGLAELWWALAFKPQFGKSEVLNSGVLFPVMLFRGLLYLAVVMAVTTGL